MDSGNMTEAEVNNSQPGEVVATDPEATKGSPQPEAIEKEELYVDVEGDQEKPKTNMSLDQTYAAWKKEKDKRQRAKEEAEAERKEKLALREKVQNLESKISEMSVGSKPTLESCNYDESEYEKALDSYYSSRQKAPAKQSAKKEPEQQSVLSDEADFYLYQSESQIKSSVEDYDRRKKSFVNKMLENRAGLDVEQSINYLAEIARQKGVDPAKAFIAMEEMPSLIDEVFAMANSPIAIGDILARAASKVKTRSAKKVESKPEPEIKTSGSVDVYGAKVQKLKQKWIDNPTAANFKQYQAAKNQKGE